MRVALVHDYLKEYGGAEKVLEALHELYPEAPIYTSVYLYSYLGPHKKRFEKYTIKTSFLQSIPFNAKLISLFRLLSPFVFKNFDLSNYDVIIVSQTGAYFPYLVRKGKAQLICYTHTPPRYLYGYKTAREWKNNKIFLVLGEVANHFLRIVDFKASQNVDQFIANSEEVRARIKKFYRSEAIVIYPPAYSSSKAKRSREVLHQDSSRQARTIREEYYVTGGRLARAKGLDIIVKAFNENGKMLKIFGKGFAGHEEELKVLAKKNIEFVGEVDEEKKFELLANAKAFVFASFDEDFGITPVEAQSVGTPVIAFKSGGVQETVIDGKTGVFFDINTPENLNKAIEKFERSKLDSKDCIKQAQKFSKERFKEQIKKIVLSV